MRSILHEDGELELFVTDTGIGIAAGDMGKVFTPFEQADSSLARKYEGIGLGMALVGPDGPAPGKRDTGERGRPRHARRRPPAGRARRIA